MTLTRELRTGIALALATLLALTAFVWGNQRPAHAADVPVSGSLILCWINQMDGIHPPVPVFNVGDCTGQNGTTTPPVNLPQCADGIDNDNDGKTDWDVPGGHGDPGCSTPTDNNESDDPAPPAQCQDGIDNDQDNLIDLADPGCSGPSDNDESNGGGGGNSADLSVVKTVSSASPAPSSTITYTITVHNSGLAAAANVAVTDLLPSGVVFVSSDNGTAYASTTGVWTVGSVASGTDMVLNIVATVAATSGVQVSNTASISHSDATDPNNGNDSSTVTFTSTDGGQGGGSNPQCSDGIDNDNDGQVDYPADSDCTDAQDNNESPESSSGGGGGHNHRSSGGSSSNSNNGEVLGAETECPMYLTSYIKYGAANDAGEVAKLQVFLNNFEANSLAVSGTYDQATLAAVRSFQRKYASDVLDPWGLKGTTGYVYYTTQKQINSIYCKFQKDFPLSEGQIEEIAYVRAIQPQLHAQGAASVSPTAAAGAASASKPVSAVGSVVLPSTQSDENAADTGNASQTAATANASSTPGWFGKFVNWLFGR
jgi:uncharacterized repeat protein (TIGR01451 family)